MIRFGIVLVLLSALLYCTAEPIVNRYDWTPIYVPVSVASKQETSAAFTADHKTIYYVEINLTPRLPFDTMEQIIMRLSHPEATDKATVSVPRFTCSVMCNGKQVMQKYSGCYYGSTVGAKVGRFLGRPGQRYTIQAIVEKPTPSLQILGPHLKIQSRSMDYKRAFVAGSMFAFGAVGAILVGMLIVMVSTFNIIRRRYQIRKSLGAT